jgi:hypothetical protein
MAITIEKHNFKNNEWKVLHTHMQLLIIDIDTKEKFVFKVKYLKRVMCSHGAQSQNNELTPSGTFSNIVN